MVSKMDAKHSVMINRNNLSMIQLVEVQANEEMGTSVDLEDYTSKILENHQEQVFVELDLPTDNQVKKRPFQPESSGIGSEDLNNYTIKLVEQHENLLLDLTSSSSENEEFGDENEQAVYETVTDLVDRVALKINVEQEKLSKNEVKKSKTRRKAVHISSDYRRYICYWCDRRYDMLSSLKAHVPSHLEQARAQCVLCPKSFTSKSSLRDHMRIHTGERPYVCKQCGRSFITSGKLGKHLRWHAKDFRHSCDICNKVFLEAYTLRCHQKVHEKKDAGPSKTPKMWSCKKCDAGFTRRDDLRLHNKDVHKIKKSNPAKKQRTTLSNDQPTSNVSITPTSEGLYECQQCVRKFFSLDSLLVHVRKHERNNAEGDTKGVGGSGDGGGGAQWRECKVCDESFQDKSLLQHHMTEVHSEVVKHKCRICQQVFNNGSTLKKHVLMHSDERPFNCDECAGTYKTKDDLKRHKRTHMVDRPFKCPQCGHGFVDNTGLIRHVRIHTGEKPFVCPDCLKAFTQSSSLKSHRAKKHPNSTIKLTNLRGGAKAAAAATINSASSSTMTDDNITDTVAMAESTVANDADLQDESGGGVAESNFTSVQGLLDWLHQQQNVSIHVAAAAAAAAKDDDDGN